MKRSMKGSMKRLAFMGLMLALGTACASADPVVYAQSFPSSSPGIGVLDLATGAFTRTGSIPSTIQYLAPGPNGLLTMNFNGDLDSINPVTGAISAIGPTGFANCSAPATTTGPPNPNCELSFGSAGGTLYTTDFDNNLYTINPTTGKATLIGKTGLPPVPFIPASTNPNGSFNFYDENLFAADGHLYANYDAGTFNPATSQNTVVIAPALYELNPNTGQATKVASTAFGLVTVINLDGTVYGFNGVTNQIETIDVANGAATVVSNIDPAAGLIEGAAPVPEPASFVLAGLGITATLLILRRRNQRL